MPRKEICGDPANLAALVEADQLGDPRVQACLRAILAPELEIQRHLPQHLLTRRWWAWRTDARCDGCGTYLCRCRVGGYPDGPIYVCVACGVVMSWREISERGEVPRSA